MKNKISPAEIDAPFKGSEIYLLHKAFVDAGGAFNENYKTLSEKTVSRFLIRPKDLVHKVFVNTVTR